MKNYTKSIAIAALLILASCGSGSGESKDKDSSKTGDSSTNVKVETQGSEKAEGENRNETPANNQEVRAKTDAKVNPDGSTISISKDGASVETKSGSKETKVDISNGKTNITIKR